MKSRTALLWLGGLGLAFVAGLVVLFRDRLGAGDVFPAYSSLRADPLGTRAFYDGLAQLDRVHVERNFQPLATLPAEPPRTIVLAGWSADEWNHVPRATFEALQDAVRAGSRLVIAMQAEAARPKPVRAGPPPSPPKQDDEPPPPRMASVDLRDMWGAQPKKRWLMQPGDGAVATQPALDAGLPDRVAWASDVYFQLDLMTGWRVLYRRGSAPVLAERRVGKGTVVLAGDSYFLSNEAIQKHRATALLVWVIGPNPRVLFDETHLGIAKNTGVAELARRYGLASAFFLLVVLAGLFIWQRSVLFVPPADDPSEAGLTYHPAAGLEALLRRAIPAQDLVAACLEDWRRTARADDQARVDAALAAVPAGLPPAVRYNAAVRALRRGPAAPPRT